MRDWPIEEMRRLREGGATWRAVGEACGCSPETARLLVTCGKGWIQRFPKDPGPGVLLRLGRRLTRRRESPEQRAFRRFPIADHKPRYG